MAGLSKLDAQRFTVVVALMPDSTHHVINNVVRVMTTDGGFRVIATDTTALARRAAEIHSLSGSAAAMLAELLTGAVLLRETMAPGNRLQLNLRAADGVRFTADAHPNGMTRGLATIPTPGQVVHFGPGAMLQASRVMHGGRVHQSAVGVSDVTGIGEALMVYAQDSAQVMATIGVSCIDTAGGIKHCGGYVVQLLPETPEGALMVMTERLADFADTGRLLTQVKGDVRALTDELVYGMPYTVLSEGVVEWGCLCSAERVVGALASLGVTEITEIIASGEVLDIDCDYCQTAYEVGPEQLRTLLSKS